MNARVLSLLVSALLAVVVLGPLSGCGGGEGDGDETRTEKAEGSDSDDD